MAVGVASPSAHGHAIISTETAISRALTIAGSGARNDQVIKTSKAITMTTGTKRDVI